MLCTGLQRGKVFLLALILGLPLCQYGQDAQLATTGYDSHVELNWSFPGLSPESFEVWRSGDGQSFSLLETTNGDRGRLLDFTGFAGDTPDVYHYYVIARSGILVEIGRTDTLSAVVSEMTDEALMEMVQRYTFRYFWDFAHPVSGMARERNSSGDVVTTGGTGFGLMAVLVGIERGFITREQGLNRLLQVVSFLQFADRYHGVFPHWMNGNNGNTIPFGQFDDGGDLVETAFLMQGLLCARRYFDQDDPLEEALRTAITGLWEDVEWDFYRRNNANVLYWHWSPNYAWQMNLPVRGFNETMMVYLLAVASPTHPVPAGLYHTGWAGQDYVSPFSWYGYPLYVGPPLGGPLFFAHYSYLGFDPRDIRDDYANYFVRNRNHTLINRAYCIANPLNHEGYSDVCWGLTASDNPWGYLAHEPLATRDNGTITPTAALSSMPYTPAESLAALKYFYRELGADLWGEMGFYDAFNLGEDWFADSYLAIDQGPIVGMIENYRTGLLWDLFMANPEIQPALDAIGFVPDVSSVSGVLAGVDWSVFPNPATGEVTIDLVLADGQLLELALFDARGRPVRQVMGRQFRPAGPNRVQLSVEDLPAGPYYLRLTGAGGSSLQKLIRP